MVYLPGRELSTRGHVASAHWGHGVTHESLVHGRSLNIRRNDDCVFSQIQLEGIPCPAPLGLHDVEGYAPQQIFESGSYSDPVSLQRFESGHARGVSHLLQEFRLGQRATRVHGFVGKKM